MTLDYILNSEQHFQKVLGILERQTKCISFVGPKPALCPLLTLRPPTGLAGESPAPEVALCTGMMALQRAPGLPGDV